jgi:hypothetical protein
LRNQIELSLSSARRKPEKSDQIHSRLPER